MNFVSEKGARSSSAYAKSGQPFSPVDYGEEWRQDPLVEELPELRAVALGPSRSGKTSFVAAIAQSFLGAPEGEAACRVLPLDASNALGDRAEAAGLGSDLAEATATAQSFRFEVTIDRPPTALELVIYDEAGAGTAAARGDPPSPLSPEWLVEARSAQLLQVCVDAASPQRDYWRRAVGQLVSALAERGGNGVRTLPFRRVLFVLGQVDRLAGVAIDGFRCGGRQEFLHRLADDGEYAIACALDPGRQLCELVGRPAIGRLLQALDPDAQVAAVTVSAGGFAAGQGRFDADGKRRAAYDDDSDWQPFGVKEALEFLVTGACSGQVVALSTADLQRPQALRLL